MTKPKSTKKPVQKKKARFVRTPNVPVNKRIPNAKYQNIYANLQTPTTAIQPQAVNSLEQTSFVVIPGQVKKEPLYHNHGGITHRDRQTFLTSAQARLVHPYLKDKEDAIVQPVVDKYNQAIKDEFGMGFKLHSRYTPDMGGGCMLTKPQQIKLAGGGGIRLGKGQLKGPHTMHLTAKQHASLHKARTEGTPMDVKFGVDQISHNAHGGGWFTDAFKKVGNFIKDNAVGAVTDPLGTLKKIKGHIKEGISHVGNKVIDKVVPSGLRDHARMLGNMALDKADQAITAKTGVGLKRKRGGTLSAARTRSGLVLPGNTTNIYN